ncbi:hypothetical protein SEUCBS139899_002924 [Sporothrix eucalyptigena]
MAFITAIPRLFFALPKWQAYLGVIVVAAVAYWVGSYIYNLFFHPLRHFPGPKLWAISKVPYARVYTSGTGHLKILELHKKYGDIVRIGPSSLSLSYPAAWNDVCGHRVQGQQENPKDPDFWRDHKHAIISANREDHARMRKVLSHGFSAKAMQAQQPLILRYVTMMTDKLKVAVKNEPSQNVVAWYNWTTFDVIGDLVFGEPFGCLDKTHYHPWVALIFEHIRGTAFLAALRKFPFAEQIKTMMMTKELTEKYNAHLALGRANVDKRLAYTEPRDDFLESLARAREKGLISYEEILDTSEISIVGGSETTATALSGATYLLCTNPDVLEKLATEIRTSFTHEDEIDLISVQKLKYLMAVIHESMRLYSPVPAGMPRRASETGFMTARGEFVPPNTDLAIWQWSLFHNPKFFTDAELFIPERWMGDERFANDKLDACQPFSVGPRNCIGKNLAYAEMRLILARILWNFDIELDPRSANWFERNEVFLLWEKPELFIKLRERA